MSGPGDGRDPGHDVRLSVVIETVNAASKPRLGLDEVLAGLAAQTYPAERIEILVVIAGEERALAEHLRREHPGVRILETEHATYFSMKTAGARAARGDVVAFLDSDCVPVATWAECLMARIMAGADVVAGKTRYPAGAPFARTFDFFNFGYVQGDATGRANAFLPNNAAFRREVFLAHPFDERIRRGGAGHLLGSRLRQRGYVLMYEPGQRVTHNCYAAGDELLMRVKAGYDSVNLARIDTDRALDETPYIQRGGLAVFAVFLRRVVFDVRAALMNRRDLGISILHVPYFLLASPIVRGLEMAAALVTIVRPGYFKEKYDW